ncbi:MAG: RNA polymerase II mediator complex subunit [Piccolia ochrophora]|nr:MAG: RNA polymerase II mediator complex subunit [Piccolia ochrophora]
MTPVMITNLENDILTLLHTLHTLSIQIHSAQPPPSSQPNAHNSTSNSNNNTSPAPTSSQTPTAHPAPLTTLTHLVSSLKTLQSTAAAPSLADIVIPPEIIAYVEDGRNPDIYTREFVELVQRGGMEVGGRSEGFRNFGEVLSREMSGVFGEAEVGNVGKGFGWEGEKGERRGGEVKRENSG